MINQHRNGIEGRTSQSMSFYDGSSGDDLLFRAWIKSLKVNSRVYR